MHSKTDVSNAKEEKKGSIYIEIDSKTPETAPFEFLSKYHYKVKTQKFKQFYSQGLLMHPSDFGWKVVEGQHNNVVKDDKGITVTELLSGEILTIDMSASTFLLFILA